MLAISVGAFDEMAITTVLPEIVAELGGEHLYGTAFSTFVLASLFGTIWAGHRCDAIGPARPFVVGLIIFSTGLLLASVAPNMQVFVLSRAIQGLGNGMIVALVFAVINLTFNEQQRPGALALISAAWVIPSLIAPSGAAAIAQFIHWRWIFPSMIPILFITATLTISVLKPYDLPLKRSTNSTPFKLNSLNLTDNIIWAAFRLSLGVATILTAFSQTSISIPLATLIIVAGLLISYQPFNLLMPSGIWRLAPGLPTAMTLRFCINFIFFGSEVFLPYMLIHLYQFSPLEAGIVLTSSALSWALGAWLQAKLNYLFTPLVFIICGGCLLILAIFGIISILIIPLPISAIFICWPITGLAVGIAFTSISSYTMNHTPKGKEGASASSAGVAAALGIGLATGLAGAIFNHGKDMEIGLKSSMISVWLMTISICFVFLAIAWCRVRNHPAGLEIKPKTV
ncbi:MAG: MFS transporter [Pseudomonadales bacterium]|nr:MFS transporter [Pseudomonadales bacterium]